MFEQQQRQESCNTLNQIKTLNVSEQRLGLCCVFVSGRQWKTERRFYGITLQLSQNGNMLVQQGQALRIILKMMHAMVKN